MSALAMSAVLAALILSGCGGGGSMKIPPPVPDDRRDIAPPAPTKISIPIDAFDKQVAREVRSWFELDRYARAIGGTPKEAFDIDAFDEVPNSSWYTNRNHVRPMTTAEIMRGPCVGDGPDPAGPWTIIRAKTEGVTPGFTIQDPTGGRYVMKFDPPGYHELATGAENVTTRLFYAAGYNTPENFIVHFHPDILVIGAGVTVRKDGIERQMTKADLDRILTRVEFRPDGTIRSTASKYLEGTILGPFRYHGTRSDDPNDFIPHEHRRELRGMRMIAAWLNHYDTKAANSLDVYVTDNGKSFVRHFLIDFGSTLGSDGDEPMQKFIGYESIVDPEQTVRNMLTFGFYTPAWEEGREVEYPSVGLYDYAIFHPMDFKFIIPNPAFENMTSRDGFWGARVVMSFTDEQLDAVVAAGQYSDPKAAAYLLEVLKARRDIIGRYWFDKMNPLDRFEVDGDTLAFADLAVTGGLEPREGTTYRCTFQRDGRTVGERRHEIGGRTRIDLPPLAEGVLEVDIQTKRGSGSWSKSVYVYLEPGPSGGGYRLKALHRQS